MSKKAKKKARSSVKEKRNPLASADPIDQTSSKNIDTPEDDRIATAVDDRKECPHVDKFVVDVEKVSTKIESSEPVRCEDCREGVADRRGGGKTKGRRGKKKGGGESKAVWVCLECGHFSCGGAGFPTIPQSHAVQHAKQYKHPLALQFKNPQLRWCFPCSTLIHGKKLAEDGSEHKDAFHDIVKAIKRQPSEVGPTADVEAVWFGSGSVVSEIADEKSGYLVKGLVNLGNTCFFNSIMQNLLAMNRLRDYFLKLDGFAGPLTAALKKLFVETNPGAGLKNSINPKSLFGSICSKAPQFRGYQQQDSHELLRCLLDRLSTEELTGRKQNKSSQDCGKSMTFVDDIFGGRLSSTVSCLECGHSSVVCEPFLDLSLPVPTKRPPSKAAQSVSRPKKSKPPKKGGKFRPKVIKEAASFNPQSSQGNGEKPFSHVGMEVPSADVSLDSIESMVENMGLTSQNLCSSQKSDNEKKTEGITRQLASMDDLTWLDFLDQDIPPNSENTGSQVDHILTNQGSETENAVDNLTRLDFLDQDAPPNSKDTASQVDHILTDQSSETKNAVDNLTWMDFLDLDTPPNSKDTASQADHILTNQGSETNNVVDNFDTHREMKLTCTEKACSPDDLTNPYNQGQCKSPDSDITSEFSKKLVVKDDLGTDSYTRLSADEEAPLQLKDGEILLLPYGEVTSNVYDVLKEGCEVSSPAVGLEQDSLDLGGFGDLFNEPECEANGLIEASVTAPVSSDSDPEEVDNTDAPVSVESCLAYFTKPELLSKTEHAWQCENCTKVLKEQRMRLKNKKLFNGYEDKNPNGASPTTTELENFDGTNISNCQVNGQVNGQVEENQGEANNQVNSIGQGKKTGAVEVSVYSAKFESRESENEETEDKSTKAERDATKRIQIDKVPSILTIHLKRFSQDARGRLSKLSGHVNFGDTLDLGPYVDTRFLQGGNYKYNLTGVVEHSGTMRGGHYVAYVRGGPKIGGKDKNVEDFVWYYASDAYVREISLEEVLRCEAYILFYEET